MIDNDSKILVSICNYNHLDYLKESIESIQNQTHSNLDICIVDDNSIDQKEVVSLVEGLRKSDDRIRLIKNDKNIGKWFCLNESIRTTDATICTSHDADDVSLNDRLQRQLMTMQLTKTFHNLCGFHHCWNEEEIYNIVNVHKSSSDSAKVMYGEDLNKMVTAGFSHPGINHYYTGAFETCGASAMFHKSIWDIGVRFNPPNANLRVTFGEDSDFNTRVTLLFKNTSILMEKLYCYRRGTTTNPSIN